MLKIALMVLMLLTSIVSANETFQVEGFENWYLQQKAWQTTPESLTWADVSWAEARLGDLTWTDYDLSFLITPKEYGEDGEVRLYFRQTMPFKTYSLNISADNINVSRYDGQVTTSRVLESTDVGIKANETAKIRLVLKETDFYVYLNDELILEIYSIKYKSGGIAFWAENSSFTVQDFIVKGARDQMIESRDIGYFPKNDPRSGGVSDLMLIYNNVNTSWNMIDALPYVAYIAPLYDDFELKVNDWFFDSFLFLALTAPDGHAFDSPSRGKPARMKEWQWFIDKLFENKKQLAAFERAYEVGKEHLDTDAKGKVFIMIPNPMAQINDFGDVDGTGSLDFSWKDADKATEHRFKAVKWYIDLVLEKWEDADFENLDLVGFYWVEEAIHYAVPGEADLLNKVSDYIRDLGLKHTWIPYFTSSGHNNWQELGFDFVMHQPNHMFNEASNVNRFADLAGHALRYGQGIEIEAENSVGRDPDKRNRFLNYLRAGVTFDWQKDAVHGYYQGTFFFGSCAIGQDPSSRELYDLLYQYVNGEFDEPLGTR